MDAIQPSESQSTMTMQVLQPVAIERIYLPAIAHPPPRPGASYFLDIELSRPQAKN
jgi:hypothetical protein